MFAIPDDKKLGTPIGVGEEMRKPGDHLGLGQVGFAIKIGHPTILITVVVITITVFIFLLHECWWEPGLQLLPRSREEPT